MDLAVFQRSRVRLWVWLLAPPALMAASLIPATWYRNHQRAALAEREALMDHLPVVERRTRAIAQLLQSVTPPAGQIAEATQEATRRVDAAAANSGLSVRSLKVTDSSGNQVALTVQVSGPMRALVQWLDEVQKPGLLIDARTALVNAIGPAADGQVNAEFTFVLRMRTT